MSKKKRAVSLFVALALVLSALVSGPVLPGGSAQAVTQAEINQMQSERNSLAAEIKELEEQIEAIQDDKDQALQQKQYLDEQIALLDQEIAQLDEIIAAYDVSIQEQQAQIDELQAKEDAQYQLFCQRVRSMEEQGTVSYLSILFNASSFSDLLNNAMLVGEIMDYDNDIISMLQATRAEVEAAQAELLDQQAEQQAVRDEQAASRAVLQEQEEKAAELVEQILAEESEYEAALAQMEAEDARIQAEMAEAQRQMAAAQAAAAAAAANGGTVTPGAGTVVSESGFYWPVPGYYTLTSKFGWRIHPIYGTSRYHNGTDISVPKGVPIGAAKSGVVTTSTYNQGGYGNYVVVTHSDGYQTLYAHMDSRAVSVGDVVSQGQTLGYVGTTGASTGYHLHFEVWYNGVRTDSEQYFPNISFDRRY